MFKTILVSYDGSAPSMRAVKKGCELARACGAKLEVVRAINSSTQEQGGVGFEVAARLSGRVVEGAIEDSNEAARIERARGVLSEQVAEILGDSEHVVDDIQISIVVGDPKETIAAHANEGDFDLLVMGRRGLGAVSSLVGSVSQRVLHDVDIPVMLVR